jgi:hypothetical protein
MPKTFTSNLPSVSTGDVYTATAHNNIVTNVNNYRVPPMCRLFNSATVTPYTTNTAITWNSESYDTDDMHSTSVNTSRITFQTAGVYLCTATIRTDATTITQGNLYARLNGGATQLGQNFIIPVSSTAISQVSSFMYSFAASDYIEWISAYAGTGTASINTISHVEAIWLGQVS